MSGTAATPSPAHADPDVLDTASGTSKFVHRFAPGDADGDSSMRSLLGNKGANLCEMAGIGLPVPPGFIVTTKACDTWWSDGRIFSDTMRSQIAAAMEWLEADRAAHPSASGLPLLVSVRSGAPVSMPGMMDTVLNLGFRNADHVAELAQHGNAQLVHDAWRRFLQMFGSVVLGVPDHRFDTVLSQIREREGVTTDAELSPAALADAAHQFSDIIAESCGPDAIPEDPFDQLLLAIGAVFDSWNGEPARVYREHHGIPHDLGTAVNVQRMVFGNSGNHSGSGVLFTRNPATGEPRIFGEYLQNAQGEDVVSGMRTPQPLAEQDAAAGQRALETTMPDAWVQLQKIVQQLEHHFRDMQDVEFTVDTGTLWMLQTRTGKRTARAALHVAVDMVEEGLISRDEALLRVDPDALAQLLVPQFARSSAHTVLAHGIPASPGAASGVVALTAEDAVARAGSGERVILVRGETSAADIAGMVAATGILTARGGATSHAAVVARGMGRPCVSGCTALHVDEDAGTVTVDSQVIHAGDVISIDGATGEVLLGEIPTTPVSIDETFAQFLGWADDVRTLGVRANADTADSAQRAHELGAQGIGLCRTEHMFFAPDRLPLFSLVVLAETPEERRTAMASLAPAIQEDFVRMFSQMDGKPVTIRLLDPPLHEFLPRTEDDAHKLADAAGVSVDVLMEAAHHLHEENPMLGHRGVRLAITHPEVYEALVAAIVVAAIEAREQGVDAQPHIMIPLVGGKRELDAARDLVATTISTTLDHAQTTLPDIPIGTMIEVPRACVVADRLATAAEFFSFGTNDLTQLTYGLSRDDTGAFLDAYLQRDLLSADPFAHVDQDGVGQLIELALDRARSVRPNIEAGVCGEHGGDPASIQFFHKAGIDYVSCSPGRVPIARLAAAHAALTTQQEPS